MRISAPTFSGIRTTWSIAVCFFAAIGVPDVASAFVCSRVGDSQNQDSGSSLAWFKRDLPFTLQAQGTADIPDLREHEVLAASFAVWEQLDPRSGGPCAAGGSDVHFIRSLSLSEHHQVGYNFLEPENNENLLLFRDADWPYEGLTAQDIIGLTTTTFDAITGEILDADIEFNSFTFNFSEDATTLSQTDLKNTAVHEIGHFLGLNHTSTADATMFDQATAGETKKRTLDCDDVPGNCF